MQVIIMCGGHYDFFEQHKALSVINGETLVARTIRLLKENNIEEIYISSNEDGFSKYSNVIHHENSFKVENGQSKGYWVDAYYPTEKPTIYLHGDVYYSENAIKTILNYNPEVNTMIGNQWALNENHDKVGEPFGWIIVDQKSFRNAINECKRLQDEGKTDRMPISWELYQVLNEHDINGFDISEETYLAIADDTQDIDDPCQIEVLNKKVGR
jgi:choline kinase